MTDAPSNCPVCKAELRTSSPETAESFAEWEYECGCILHREDDGKLHPYAVCGEATRLAVDKINKAA